MKRTQFLVILFLSFSIVGLSQNQRVKEVVKTERADLPAKNLNEGNKFYRQQSFNSAIKSYNEAITLLKNYSKDPSTFHSRYANEELRKRFMILSLRQVAKSYQKAGKFNDAQASFKEALALNKENAGTWLDYGLFLENRSQRTEAINSFMNAAKYAEVDNPNSKKATKAKNTASDAKYKLGRLTEASSTSKAKEYYQESISLNPSKYQSYLFLGKIYESEKKYALMLNTYETLESVLKKLPRKYRKNVGKQMPKTLFQQSVALYELKKYNQAIAQLNQMLKLKETKSTEKNGGYYYLGMCYKKLSQDGRAKSFLTKVKKGIYKSSAEHEIKYGFKS